MSSPCWEEFFKRFGEYGELPTWGWFGKAPKKSLKMSLKDRKSIADHGRKRLKRAKFAFDKIQARRPGLLPKTPQHLKDHLSTLRVVADKDVVGKQSLKSLWDAITFDVADYSCEYCGRNTFEVFEEESHRRGLFLTVDHLVPKTEDPSAEWDPGNLRCACWSCNHIKGRLSKEAFEVELRSLAEAVRKK